MVRSGGRFCVATFGRNLASDAVKILFNQDNSAINSIAGLLPSNFTVIRRDCHYNSVAQMFLVWYIYL